MSGNGVSIIICCHNSAARLPVTIRYIAMQKVPDHVACEFIIVDNASRDGTASVAHEEWEKYLAPFPMRIVSEPVPGLSRARAKGFEEAQFDFVLMCDDDNWLHHDYVLTAYNIMMENANIAALGGLGELVYEVNPPEFIRQSYIYAAGKQAPFSGKVRMNKVYGAGCVIRKSAYRSLLQMGFKSFLIDRKGTELSSGGDHELCYALAIMGYDIWYDERLRFSHFITKDRLTWEYFVRYGRESSRCFDVLTSYKMVAASNVAAGQALSVILRDLFYSLRTFAKINLKRLLIPRDTTERKLLYFKYVVFKYRIIAYFTKFREMVRNHREIVRFRETCDKTHENARRSRSKYHEILRSLFSF